MNRIPEIPIVAVLTKDTVFFLTGREPSNEFRPTRRNVNFELKRKEPGKTRKRDLRRNQLK